jgi:hypothetical protein
MIRSTSDSIFVSWLQQVEYHAQSNSRESQSSLQALARTIPPYNETNRAVSTLIYRVKLCSQKQNFDPELHGLVTKAIASLSTPQAFSPPPAARRLFYGDDEI